jgi:tetratricopeptide (TPR) repeat protein
VPVADVSHLAPLERQRNLGLAYMEASRNPLCLPYVDTFCERARDLLEEVHAAGLRDAEMAAALATLNMSKNHVRGRAFAREALAAKDVSAEVRGDALCVLAMCEAKDNNFQSATAIANELVRVRRGPEDWCILGTCYQMQNQPREALAALQYALTIRPDRHVIHLWLALIYRQQGDAQRAKEHQEKGQWLFDHRPQ